MAGSSWSVFRARIIGVILLLLTCSALVAGAQQDNRALAKQALEQALRAAEKEPLAGDRSALTRRAIMLMSRVDPPTAASLCVGLPRASDAIRALGESAAALAPKDLPRAQKLIATAVRLLRDLESDPQRTAEMSYLFALMASFDPAGALTAAGAAENPEVYEYVWTKVAEIAPQTALADLKTSALPSAARLHHMALLLPSLARQDSRAALVLSEEIIEPLLKSQALAEVCLSLPAEEALAVAQRIPDSLIRAQALRAAAERLAPTNPAAALAAIQDLPADKDSALAGVALALAATDWPQARDIISRITAPRVRRDAMGLLVVALAGRDIKAAVQLADSAPEMPAWAWPALCSALAITDAEAARGRAGQLENPLYRDLALAGVAQALAQRDTQRAEEILLEITEPSLRFTALQDLVSAWAPRDMEKALSLTGLAAETAEVYALRLHMTRALAADPTRALDLAKTCPPSPERTEVLLDIAAAVAGRDRKEARRIAALALNEAAAGHALAARLARTDPALAMSCANEIVDPLSRGRAFCDIAEMLLGAPAALPALARPEVQRVVEGGGVETTEATTRRSASEPSDTPLEIVSTQPHELGIRLPNAEAGSLYRVRYQGAGAAFVWENLQPGADGAVMLLDDRHLQPKQRLQCASRGTEADPAYFDDFSKAESAGKTRLTYGVPVSTFGGPGYLSSAPTWLQRDSRGGFWLYQDRRPWRIVAFDGDFNYRFTLVFPGRVLGFASDMQANLYVLQEGNLLSRFDAEGRALAHWKLPEGRGAGQFIGASGLAVDGSGEYLYLADEKLGRVQRFDKEMRSAPLPSVPWGWVGREDLAYLQMGAYQAESKYRLDRPQRLALGPGQTLYVDCAYYVTRFDLATGEQVPFGRSEVLGWGGTFTDSAHSVAAANNGHWQDHRLAGVDPQGNIYISDTANSYRRNLRLQRFSPDGEFLAAFDLDTDLRDAAGGRVYVTPVLGLGFGGDSSESEGKVWLAEAGGRIYESQGISSGGTVHLGPGAPGRQFDLTLARPEDFVAEKQAGRVERKAEGILIAFPAGRQGTRNCETEQNSLLANDATSIWIPAKLGEPFHVSLLEEGREIPASDYVVELENQPGPFGTHYDFFRVTNKSGHAWKQIRFVAETLPAQ